MLRRIYIAVLLMFLASLAFSEEQTNGYRTITSLYLNGSEWKHFYLDQPCNQSKSYYTLQEARVDVAAFYNTMMAAFYAGKKVHLFYEPTGTFCEVTRMSIE